MSPMLDILSENETLQTELVNPGHVFLNKMLHVDVPQRISNKQWVQEQKLDNAIGKILELCHGQKLGKKYKATSNDDGERRTMLQHRQHYVVRNKLLYKRFIAVCSSTEI